MWCHDTLNIIMKLKIIITIKIEACQWKCNMYIYIYRIVAGQRMRIDANTNKQKRTFIKYRWDTRICSWCKSQRCSQDVCFAQTKDGSPYFLVYVDDLYDKDILRLRKKIARRCDRLKHTVCMHISIVISLRDSTSFHALMNTQDREARALNGWSGWKREYFKENIRCSWCRRRSLQDADAAARKVSFAYI